MKYSKTQVIALFLGLASAEEEGGAPPDPAELAKMEIDS